MLNHKVSYSVDSTMSYNNSNNTITLIWNSKLLKLQPSKYNQPKAAHSDNDDKQ